MIHVVSITSKRVASCLALFKQHCAWTHLFQYCRVNSNRKLKIRFDDSRFEVETQASCYSGKNINTEPSVLSALCNTYLCNIEFLDHVTAKLATTNRTIIAQPVSH